MSPSPIFQRVILETYSLRLRVETLLGYKMVKYLRSIELVADYTHIGEGQGGFREDYQYYGKKAEI